MDEQDFVFVNKPLTAEEEKEFSDFLKKRKSGLKTKRNLRKVTAKKKVTANWNKTTSNEEQVIF